MRSEKEAVIFPSPLCALMCSGKEIPFRGEPLPIVTTEALRKVTETIRYSWVSCVRHLGQVRREQPGAELDKKIEKLLPRMIQQFELETALTLDQFKDWYKRSKKILGPKILVR